MEFQIGARLVVEDDIQAFIQFRTIGNPAWKLIILKSAKLWFHSMPSTSISHDFQLECLNLLETFTYCERDCAYCVFYSVEHAQQAVGNFGSDNRAGIEGILHTISAIQSRNWVIVGLTCCVGREVGGHIDMVYDLLQYGKSLLFVGR
ncbi:hypothetical protein RJ641_029957 [Dillenia turbinata]|uniref:Uncharacterized protein n=1 Tax=Dillenia turbinata TaxID=194707 RepID=A0AAN8ZJR5_9MAGN